MSQNEANIVAMLISKGKKLFQSPRRFVEFTDHQEANKLLDDIGRYPHAFVLGCLMDKQVKAERAWLIPYHISTKLGDFEFSNLQNLSLAEITDLMTNPKPLHRFSGKMSREIYGAIQRIRIKFNGDASLIWSNSPSSAQVVYEFLQFEGIARKIATMAANLLARHFKIPFKDYYSIDISADVHVRRVFYRVGLIEKGTSVEKTIDRIIYKARSLNPKFPGLIDSPVWEIGHNWCKPKKPLCGKCYLQDICPKKGV